MLEYQTFLDTIDAVMSQAANGARDRRKYSSAESEESDKIVYEWTVTYIPDLIFKSETYMKDKGKIYKNPRE